MPKTNVDDFMDELGAGIVKEKMAHILSDAALAAVLHGSGNKKSKVLLELSVQRVGENNQVIVSHKIGYSIPTKRGKRMEEDTTETPFHVGKGGVMTINPPREEMEGQFTLQEVGKGE